jgi:hypothetical protein
MISKKGKKESLGSTDFEKGISGPGALTKNDGCGSGTLAFTKVVYFKNFHTDYSARSTVSKLRRHSCLGELTHLWEAGFSAADASVDGTPDVVTVATVGAPLLLEHSILSADFPAKLSKLSSSVPDKLGTTNCEEED